MIKSENYRYGLPLYVLYPGEHYFTQEACYLSTVAGYCIVICFYDKIRRMGAMGHFIVPGTIGTEGIYKDEIAEHGIIHLELIIADFVKSGGDRKDLAAKIFGAGYIKDKNYGEDLVKSNIDFIHQYLGGENIEVKSQDLGGNFRRQVLFRPDTGEAFRKILQNNDDNSEFAKLEMEYIDRAFRNKAFKTKYILFE